MPLARCLAASYSTMAACAEVVPELRATASSLTRRHEVACIKVETLSA